MLLVTPRRTRPDGRERKKVSQVFTKTLCRYFLLVTAQTDAKKFSQVFTKTRSQDSLPVTAKWTVPGQTTSKRLNKELKGGFQDGTGKVYGGQSGVLHREYTLQQLYAKRIWGGCQWPDPLALRESKRFGRPRQVQAQRARALSVKGE